MKQFPCWNCNRAFEVHGGEKIAFRATCDHCAAYLHVCVACQYYRPGKPNDCLVPGTDRVADREYFNYCEEFKPGREPDKPKLSIDDARRMLFGDD